MFNLSVYDDNLELGKSVKNTMSQYSNKGIIRTQFRKEREKQKGRKQRRSRGTVRVYTKEADQISSESDEECVQKAKMKAEQAIQEYIEMKKAEEKKKIKEERNNQIEGFERYRIYS